MEERFESPRFEPKTELEKVRLTSTPERKAKLEEWKAAYIEQRKALADTQMELMRRLQEDPRPTHEELVAQFKEAAEKGRLSEKQQRVGLSALDIVEERRKIIEKVTAEYKTG